MAEVGIFCHIDPQPPKLTSRITKPALFAALMGSNIFDPCDMTAVAK
jgi:hypothetical protein